MVLILLLIKFASYGYNYYRYNEYTESDLTKINLNLETVEATDPTPSIIYAVTDAHGDDDCIIRLIDLMDSHDQPFYQSSEEDETRGSSGFIGNTDVVIIKVNSQWDERGGTNTDLVRSIVAAIIEHPDDWNGEIVIADNGQAQYGAAGKGGSLDWMENNAQNHSQSLQDVADIFAEHRVSAYLWDEITNNAVQEFAEGDDEDGYVVETSIMSRTDTVISYPKFTTPHGTQISFKYGLYNSELEDYDMDRLKIVNVPILKTHMIYGVTGAVKNYMGVPSDKLSAGLGYRIHKAVGKGAMGTLMAQTRVPILNIVDAIYVNAEPKNGPSTSYLQATEVDIVAASSDPFALDYWGSKNILCEICHEFGDDIRTLDPDNTESGGWGDWLRLSLDELTEAGYGFTVDSERITVFVG